ncbi:MAG: RNA 2',3'-cyclic phosphodiesterase [Caldisericales bacterium]|nr:RNA 2',3'-cyclic phosphodiesterase [Caldisericia bacterium]NMD14509.1 RNA 2',3'-cyclic phosphodiesterase [Caldisericales bacterium]
MAIRTFIALGLDASTLTYLDEIMPVLKSSGASASWTRKGNFHLTLKFLGDTEEGIAQKISGELEGMVFQKIPYRFSRFGGFPNLRGPRVLWVGLESPTCAEVAQKIDGICNKFGFSLEERPFVSHLTLGRIKEPFDFVKAVAELPSPPQGELFFKNVVFFKSILSNLGPAYEPLWSKELG